AIVVGSPRNIAQTRPWGQGTRETDRASSCSIQAMPRCPLLLVIACAAPLAAQNPQGAPRLAGSAAAVTSILPPRTPLPAEAVSAGVTRFSFIAYGDTRGRDDGVSEQYEHSLVVRSMLQTIRSMQNGPDPVRFVLQS